MRKRFLRILAFSLGLSLVLPALPSPAVAATDATLSLSPNTVSVAVGESFYVDLMVDTGTNTADLYGATIKFPTATLDLDQAADFTGSPFDFTLDDPVTDESASNGTIFVSAVYMGSEAGVTGADIQVARLHFTALEAGTATIDIVANGNSFDHNAPATSGSSIQDESATEFLGSATDTTVTVTASSNSSPSVNVTAPSGGATYAIGDSVTLTASASDTDGTVSSIQFQVDGANVGAAGSGTSHSVAWDTTSKSAGTHSIRAIATDNDGASTTSSAVTVTLQDPVTPSTTTTGATGVTFTPFAQTSTLSEDKASASATITWSTNSATVTSLQYGLLSSSLPTTSTDDSYSTNHTATLSNLKPCTLYYYKVTAVDESEISGTSETKAIVTEGCEGTPSLHNAFAATTASGGTGALGSNGSTLQVNVPSGFYEADRTFQAFRMDSTSTFTTAGALAGGLKLAGAHLYRLAALDSAGVRTAAFTKPIELVIAYSDEDISGIDESSLGVRQWDADKSAQGWRSIDGSCTVTAASNTITCTTSSFSLFALAGTASAATPTTATGSGSTGTTSGGTVSGTLPETGLNILGITLATVLLLGALLSRRTTPAASFVPAVPDTSGTPEPTATPQRPVIDIIRRS